MKRPFYILLLSMMFLVNLHAQEHTRILEVKGQASVQELPEEVVMSIPLKVIELDYLSCNQALNKSLNSLLKDLKEKGISEKSINTDNYRVSENTEYENGKRVQKGYRGDVTITVRDVYRPDMVNTVLESVTSFSLSFSIHFLLSQSQKDRLSKSAIKSAVEDAKTKAIVLSDAADVNLGPIIKISYDQDSFRPGPLLSEKIMMTDSEMSSSDPNLSPSLISLYKSVGVVWQID